MKRTSILWVTVAAAALSGCGQKAPEVVKAKAPEPISVATALAKQETVERTLMATGSLSPDETTTVSAEVQGRVAKLYFDFGQPVKKGQVMAEIDTHELSLQLERMRALLAQTMARVGMDPNKPEAVPETTPMIRQAWAQMEDARSKFENAQRLVKSGDISQERFNEMEKAFLARKAGFEAMQDDYRTQLAGVRSMQADVKLAEKRLRDAVVKAPFDGEVSVKHVSPGQYIKENVPIYTLVKVLPLRLRVEVPEVAVGQVKMGTTLKFTTESVPGVEFKAVVRELNPSLDSRSRTLSAEARLVGSDARLKPGAFVQVTLVTQAAQPVVTVPKAAVYTVAGLNKVFTIENGKAVEHKIPEIVGSNGTVHLPDGLIPAGAVVAMSKLSQLTDGVPVKAGGQS
jgi:RND family efflux transporter MFP subunit